MVKVLREYTENNIVITEYTKDGETVSHVVKRPVPKKDDSKPVHQPTIEDKINFVYYKMSGVIE